MRIGRIETFIAGVIIGTALACRCQRDVREYLDRQTRDVRARAAERLGSAADTLQATKDRLERGLTGTTGAAR
jgi:hypothetical protein